MNPEFGIAQLDLPAQDVQRLKSVMVAAITAGTISAHWRMTGVADAHLIIRAPNAAPVPASRMATRLVATLAGESERLPAGNLRLPWPIRSADLLQLLHTVEQNAARESSDSLMAAAQHPMVQFAGLVRHSDAPADLAWRIDGLGGSPLYIAPARRQYFHAESLRSVTRGAIRANLEFKPIALEALPIGSVTPRPMVMLQWSVGVMTGSLGLLPWMNPQAAYRLRRFPEFQILHHDPLHRRLAAVFSRPTAGLDRVSEVMQSEVGDVRGFLNGAELCGYLHPAEVRAGVREMTRGPNVQRSRLAGFFRRALGIASDPSASGRFARGVDG